MGTKTGVDFGGRHYDIKDLLLIVRIQTKMRGFLAKKKVKAIRTQMYGPNNMDGRYDAGQYDRINVEVSFIFQCIRVSSVGNEKHSRTLCI